jgi:putative aminopeptidase FrvX
MKLLKQLCEIHSPSGEEWRMKEFIINYLKENSKNWKVKPTLIEKNIQDNLILVFGKPKLAIFAHMDSVGFTARYNNQLVRIGSPVIKTGTNLQAHTKNGIIKAELIYDEDDDRISIKSDENIEVGTSFVFCSNFKEEDDFIVSPFLDNRLGIWNCLRLAEKLENGIIAFTSWEEHGGGAVEVIAKKIEKYKIRQALISDITWVSAGVFHGAGSVVSLRDKNIPRRKFVDLIIKILEKKDLKFQIEVEESGSSDGGYLQKTPYAIDWCFVGAPQDNSHSNEEKVHKNDIKSMLEIYEVLSKELQKL